MNIVLLNLYTRDGQLFLVRGANGTILNYEQGGEPLEKKTVVSTPVS
jgi:hypothetical protein